MLDTTLCYIEKDDCYLMLHRTKKKQDPNEGKWIGVGGKVEPGETPDECLLREVREETGIQLHSFERRGVIYFYASGWESEVMYLYTAACDEDISVECAEGELKWVPKDQIMNLHLWEGDRIFLKKLIEGERDIKLTLQYEGDKLVNIYEELKVL